MEEILEACKNAWHDSFNREFKELHSILHIWYSCLTQQTKHKEL